MADEKEDFYLVRHDVLPEAMQKTIQVKELLEKEKVKTIHEAVKQYNLSRSAFYKYKDTVFPFRAVVKDEIVTLFIHLEDHPGTLSHLLGTVSEYGSNVLTIHQTIPIQGKANVTLSLDIAGLTSTIDDLIKALGHIEFVKQVNILSSGV